MSDAVICSKHILSDPIIYFNPMWDESFLIECLPEESHIRLQLRFALPVYTALFQSPVDTEINKVEKVHKC